MGTQTDQECYRGGLLGLGSQKSEHQGGELGLWLSSDPAALFLDERTDPEQRKGCSKGHKTGCVAQVF